MTAVHYSYCSKKRKEGRKWERGNEEFSSAAITKEAGGSRRGSAVIAEMECVIEIRPAPVRPHPERKGMIAVLMISLECHSMEHRIGWNVTY